jgi:hypothetical protein
MKKVLQRRPSAALVISIMALVLAASGSAVAASTLFNGDKLIKKHSLSGNRLHNHTITGKQINKSKLGKVPSAKNADHATTADSATNANNANNANNATNASELGGKSASSYLTTGNRIGTNGVVKESASSTGNTVTLFSVGPFTVTMTCTSSGSGTALKLNGQSTENGSDLNGTLNVPANTSTDLGGTVDIAATTSASTRDDVNIDFEAPSGAQAVLIGATGVNSLGADCWANWVGIH